MELSGGGEGQGHGHAPPLGPGLPSLWQGCRDGGSGGRWEGTRQPHGSVWAGCGVSVQL